MVHSAVVGSNETLKLFVDAAYDDLYGGLPIDVAIRQDIHKCFDFDMSIAWSTITKRLYETLTNANSFYPKMREKYGKLEIIPKDDFYNMDKNSKIRYLKGFKKEIVFACSVTFDNYFDFIRFVITDPVFVKMKVLVRLWSLSADQVVQYIMNAGLGRLTCEAILNGDIDLSLIEYP